VSLLKLNKLNASLVKRNLSYFCGINWHGKS